MPAASALRLPTRMQLSTSRRPLFRFAGRARLVASASAAARASAGVDDEEHDRDDDRDENSGHDQPAAAAPGGRPAASELLPMRRGHATTSLLSQRLDRGAR